MSLRNTIINYQNKAERAFEEKKSFKNVLHYTIAFLTFMLSNFWATLGWPFRSLKKMLSPAKPTSQMLSGDTQNIDELLANHPLILLDFWAEWCGPCVMMNPILDNFIQQNEGITVIKINADLNSSLLKKYKIRGIPHFLLIKNAKELKRHAGPMTVKDLEVFCFS